MIVDKLLRLSDEQAVTATGISTDVIDLSVNRDIGTGTNLYVIFSISESFNNATGLAFTIVTSNNAAGLGNSITVGSTGTVLLAGATKGSQFVVKLDPQINSTGKRYIGARYVVTGGTPTKGKVSADFVTDYQDAKKYYHAI